MTPTLYKERIERAHGIGALLAGEYWPYDRSCKGKVRYSFNRALSDASELWENGDFLLVSTSACSVATSMLATTTAKTASCGKSASANGVECGSRIATGKNINHGVNSGLTKEGA